MRLRLLSPFLFALSGFSSASAAFAAAPCSSSALGVGSFARAARLTRWGAQTSRMSMAGGSGESLDHPLQTSPAADGIRWSPVASAKGPVRVILGSKSSTRRLLLSSMGVEYEMLNPEIDEKAIRDKEAEKLVLALAHAKADALLKREEVKQATEGTTLLVTCDQVVVYEGEILEKPEDAAEAQRFISGYGKAPCSTVGGIVVTNVESGKRCESLDKASIFFKDIPQDVIDALIKKGEVFYCAGGLMVEAPSIQPYLVKIEGSMDSVMGFGRSTASKLLDQALEG